MMKAKYEEELTEVLWVKTIIYSVIILILISILLFTPKKVFDEDMPFQLATSMAITSDDNLLLYDYDVYGTIERFNEGLIVDVEETKLAFKERNEILVVKVPGDIERTEVKDDYIYITSKDVPELNIEYYLVKDMTVNGISIQCRTFIMLFQDISQLTNSIYFALYFVFIISVFTPTATKLTRCIIVILKRKRLVANHDE